MKSFLRPMPASKSVRLFCALILLVASRSTWDFWSNLDKLIVQGSLEGSPPHNVVSWGVEPKMNLTRTLVVDKVCVNGDIRRWGLARKPPRVLREASFKTINVTLQMMLPTVFWTPKSVLRKIPWVSKLLGMSTTTGGASTIEMILSMEMSTQHTPCRRLL